VDPGDEPLSEPEPDLIALKRTSDPSSVTTHTPADLALVVEVSDREEVAWLATPNSVFPVGGVFAAV
jgi:hypothetical protein